MKQYILAFLLILFYRYEAGSQTIDVWPGDANNNGQVNNVDLLQIGLAYNNIGPARDSISFGWQAQSATPWPLVLANNVNSAFADANGDGLVNYYYDAFPVYVHYGKTHGVVTPDVFPHGTPDVDPALFLDTSNLSVLVHPGATLTLPLTLGTAELPVENLYGLAFSLHVDPEIARVDDINVNFNPTSWANPDNDRIYSTHRASSSRLDVAWVRTDHNERSGYGPIGNVSIVIIDVVVSLKDKFPVVIDSIQLIDRFGNKTAIAGDTLLVNLSPDAVTGETEPGAVGLKIWPNPVFGLLHLRAGIPIDEIILYDATGHEQARITPDNREIDWPVAGLPGGLYLLEARTDKQVLIEKIVIK